METIDKPGEKKKHASKLPKRAFGYFRDDQILFLVTHKSQTISGNLLERFRLELSDHLTRMKEETADKAEMIEAGGTIDVLPQKFSFPAINMELSKKRLDELQKLEMVAQEGKGYFLKPLQDPFSLLVCNLKDTPDDPRFLLTTISRLRKLLRGQIITLERPVGTAATKVANTETPEAGSAGPHPDIQELPTDVEAMKIEDLMPNWLMSAASQGAGTGGPGGLPTPFKGTNASAPYQFDAFIKELEDLKLYGNGANVDVAILDTAPCPHDLVLAPKEWPDNALIQGLLGANGKLHLYPATYQELRRMANTSLNRHDYPMTDHGLFAAGIVHSIVPEAEIHLIEVLNQFGVGDLASLAQGLEKVYKEIYKSESGRHLIVNCSWMLDLPLSEDQCSSTEDDDSADREFEEAVLQFVQDEKEQALALWAACNNLFLAGAQVVAAAGNDWRNAEERRGLRGMAANGDRSKAPQARYPAGFVSVVGVGALPRKSLIEDSTKHRASNYSNLGDKPAVKGIMTLGGEEGEGEGVLGLYLSEKFPLAVRRRHPHWNHKRKLRMVERKGDEKKNCMAWWAGTSFATPILTATIAAVLSSSNNPGDTQTAVRTLYGPIQDPVIQQALTEADEDGMLVTQG